MSEKTLNNTSRTNWEKIEEISDGEIDLSDIAPLEKNFFSEARLRRPRGKVAVMLSVDEETNEWYQSHGDQARTLMNIALKLYAEAHQEHR